jgi:CubicO group peptidase (beta-lactamase class C family)
VSALWIGGDGTTITLGPLDDVYQLASITKPLFSYALLVAHEEGTLPLDQPVGPEGATVAHVMAHASGLGPEEADPSTRVGTRRIYSNGGFDLLGRALSEAARMPTAEYLREAVCEPLGMTATWLEGSPAHGAVSTVRDLSRFCNELTKPTLVHPSTLMYATQPFLPGLSGVLPGFGRHEPNQWGLGFEIRGKKDPHWTGPSATPATLGHFGGAGTFFWIEPETKRFAICLTDTPFGPWAARHWPEFNEAILRG